MFQTYMHLAVPAPMSGLSIRRPGLGSWLSKAKNQIAPVLDVIKVALPGVLPGANIVDPLLRAVTGAPPAASPADPTLQDQLARVPAMPAEWNDAAYLLRYSGMGVDKWAHNNNTTGWAHYCLWGQTQGFEPATAANVAKWTAAAGGAATAPTTRPANWDDAAYLAKHPEVAAWAAQNGRTGWDHYDMVGRSQGYQPEYRKTASAKSAGKSAGGSSSMMIAAAAAAGLLLLSKKR